MSEAARALVERTTTTQGIPQHVDDRAVLAKVAGILLATRRDDAGPKASVTDSLTATALAQRGGRRAHST